MPRWRASVLLRHWQQPSTARRPEARHGRQRRDSSSRPCGQERTGDQGQRHDAGCYCGDPAGRGTRRWQPLPKSLKRVVSEHRQDATAGHPRRYLGCWRLSGLGHPLCGVPARIVAATGRSIMSQLCTRWSRSSCLNSKPPRVPITWEAYARAAGPALVHYPVFPTWGPLRVGGLHTENGKQHRTMPSPHPIDIHVGLRIRQRRRLLDMSQQTRSGLFRTTAVPDRQTRGHPPADRCPKLAAMWNAG
jgi:hypothetical protein